MGHPMRLELTGVGLLVKLANRYTTRGAPWVCVYAKSFVHICVCVSVKSLCNLFIYIYIYIYMCVCVCVCVYISVCVNSLCNFYIYVRARVCKSVKSRWKLYISRYNSNL